MVVLYAIFVIWSYCEAMNNGGAAFDGFPILQARSRQAKKYKPMFAGLFGTNAFTLAGELPVYYGSLATPGMMGGSKIFGGRRHDTDYHPGVKA